MKLSHTTTEAEINAPILAARQAILDRLTGGADSKTLLSYVHELWAAEAVGRLRYGAVNVLASAHEAGQDPNLAITKYLVSVLAVGADDAWSGRDNDAKRSAFDAVRDEASRLHWDFRPATQPQITGPACLLDRQGDWWVSEDGEHFRLPHHGPDEEKRWPLGRVARVFGIDSTPGGLQ